VKVSQKYLEAWRQRNYGVMAKLLSPLIAESSFGRTAGQVREAFEDQELTGYQLERVDHTAAAVGLVDALLEADGVQTACRLRWIRSGPDGRGVAPNEVGAWRLITWTKEGMQSARAVPV
jgi:hypothetical protein